MLGAEREGRVRNYFWRKIPAQITTIGVWFDLAMSSGNPIAKYWFDATPLIAKQISQSADGGIYHGANVSPQTKYLRMVTTRCATSTPLPMTMILCDYLLYYPTIDEGTTDPQVMDNTVSLSRYTDGSGVMILPISIASRTGGQSFVVSYTNQDGVSGRTTSPAMQNTVSVVGSVVTSNRATQTSANPFLGLQDNDTGVRSIQSVTMLGSDTGLFSLILVKPIGWTAIKEITAPYEKDFWVSQNLLPEIKDDAFLSFLILPQGSVTGIPIFGDLKVIWN